MLDPLLPAIAAISLAAGVLVGWFIARQAHRRQRARDEKELQRAKAEARTDPLTGLWNRRGFDEQYPDVAEADDANWMQAISFEQIHEAIKNLPDGCREVFNLYVLEDHTHQQIAAALNISASTSKSQYHRARLLLKERLRKQFIQYG